MTLIYGTHQGSSFFLNRFAYSTPQNCVDLLVSPALEVYHFDMRVVNSLVLESQWPSSLERYVRRNEVSEHYLLLESLNALKEEA